MKQQVRPHINKAVSAFDGACVPYYADVDMAGDFFCKICRRIQSTRFGIYDISVDDALSLLSRYLSKCRYPNPNVMLELGMALAFGKKTIIIMKQGQRPPSDLTRTDILFYTTPYHLETRLAERLPQVLG